MTPSVALLHLRMAEIAFLIGTFFWLNFYYPISQGRAVRLTITGILMLINITAVIVIVGWAKVTLW